LKAADATRPSETAQTHGESALRLVVLGHRTLRRWRCTVFELLGSARYSRTALHGLDRKLEPYLPDGGVFVEAGANDGFRKSNTYHLERFRGWTGILIEPVPELAAQCERRRRGSRVYQCALVGGDHAAAEVVIAYADLCSEISVAGRPRPRSAWGWDKGYDIAVPARTLTDVLAEDGATHIDFLSLDLQGFEAAALAGLDLDRWAPRIMLVEIVDDDAQRAVDAVLGERYERLGRITPHDVLYRIAAEPPMPG
jgi:FkbM family methyltransferase